MLEAFNYSALMMTPEEGVRPPSYSDEEWEKHRNMTGQSIREQLDEGYTLLGIRTGWDVDDVEVPAGEELDFGVNFVSNDSPISGPRLEVVYEPVPEPGTGIALASGVLLLTWLRGRAGARLGAPRSPVRHQDSAHRRSHERSRADS